MSMGKMVSMPPSASRHKDRTGAIAGNGEPMLLQIPAS